MLNLYFIAKHTKRGYYKIKLRVAVYIIVVL